MYNYGRRKSFLYDTPHKTPIPPDIPRPRYQDTAALRGGSAYSYSTSQPSTDGNVGSKGPSVGCIMSPLIEQVTSYGGSQYFLPYGGNVARERAINSPLRKTGPEHGNQDKDSLPPDKHCTSSCLGTESTQKYTPYDHVEVLSGMNRVCVYTPRVHEPEPRSSVPSDGVSRDHNNSTATGTHSPVSTAPTQPLVSPLLNQPDAQLEKGGLQLMLGGGSQNQEQQLALPQESTAITDFKAKPAVCSTGVQTEPLTDASLHVESSNTQHNEVSSKSMDVACPVDVQDDMPRSKCQSRGLVLAPVQPIAEILPAKMTVEGEKSKEVAGGSSPLTLTGTLRFTEDPSSGKKKDAALVDQPNKSSPSCFVDLRSICAQRNSSSSQPAALRVEVKNPSTNVDGGAGEASVVKPTSMKPLTSECGVEQVQKREQCAAAREQALGFSAVGNQRTARHNTAWYLNTSDVLQPQEFKNLLRDIWLESAQRNVASGGASDSYISNKRGNEGRSAVTMNTSDPAPSTAPRPTAPDDIIAAAAGGRKSALSGRPPRPTAPDDIIADGASSCKSASSRCPPRPTAPDDIIADSASSCKSASSRCPPRRTAPDDVMAAAAACPLLGGTTGRPQSRNDRYKRGLQPSFCFFCATQHTRRDCLYSCRYRGNTGPSQTSVLGRARKILRRQCCVIM
uniref:Uncharacterized protein TCIL3000_11_7700 n=1 Tax=Trypanosoma congolense (strain IL3000) TaxID=1068625 RepID=G0V110_TRYCI|nr:unnamed protein product [Trypanosoma congolense IL3000]